MITEAICKAGFYGETSPWPMATQRALTPAQEAKRPKHTPSPFAGNLQR